MNCSTDILTRCALASLLEEMGLPEETLCHWNAALLCDPDNLKAREGWLGAGNESATSAARSVRKLTRTIGCQLRVIGIAVDQAAPIAKQSEAQRRVGSIRPPQTFLSHHETTALLARHGAFAIGLIPLCIARLPSVDGTGGLDVMPRGDGVA